MNSKLFKENFEYSLAFIGDVCCTTNSGLLPLFSPAIELFFKKKNKVIANLETVLCDGGQSVEKAVSFHVAPEMAKHLRDVGINVVCLANNHTFDFGIEGFQSTITALGAAGIEYFGLFRKETKTQQPYIFKVDGCNIGIFGYTIGNNRESSTFIPSLDEHQIQKNIASFKICNIDRVIINLHWGEEYVAYPSPDQQRIARGLIDCGADVIIGHHPHVVQGFESYKNGVIFYSLGNFNFMGSRKLQRHFQGTRWGLIALLNFSSSLSVKYDYIPIQIDNNYRACFVSEEEAKTFVSYLKDISAPLYPKMNKLFWLRHASFSHFRNHLPCFIIRIKKYGGLHFLQMIRWLISPSNYGFYLGLLLSIISKVCHPSSSGPICPKPKEKSD